jgi:hypothetical protein
VSWAVSGDMLGSGSDVGTSVMERLRSAGVTGAPLAAVFHPPRPIDPDTGVRGSLLVVHCFTCSKDLHIMSRLARRLRGAAVRLHRARGERRRLLGHHPVDQPRRPRPGRRLPRGARTRTDGAGRPQPGRRRLPAGRRRAGTGPIPGRDRRPQHRRARPGTVQGRGGRDRRSRQRLGADRRPLVPDLCRVPGRPGAPRGRAPHRRAGPAPAGAASRRRPGGLGGQGRADLRHGPPAQGLCALARRRRPW